MVKISLYSCKTIKLIVQNSITMNNQKYSFCGWLGRTKIIEHGNISCKKTTAWLLHDLWYIVQATPTCHNSQQCNLQGVDLSIYLYCTIVKVHSLLLVLQQICLELSTINMLKFSLIVYTFSNFRDVLPMHKRMQKSITGTVTIDILSHKGQTLLKYKREETKRRHKRCSTQSQRDTVATVMYFKYNKVASIKWVCTMTSMRYQHQI